MSWSPLRRCVLTPCHFRVQRSIVDVFELDKLSQFSRSDEKSDAKKEAL